MGYVKFETLINTLHHSLAEVQVQKQGDTLRDVQVPGKADRLADRLKAVKAGKVGETLTDLKAASLVVTLAEIEAETAGKTVSNVEAQALVASLCGTPSEVCGVQGTSRNGSWHSRRCIGLANSRHSGRIGS